MKGPETITREQLADWQKGLSKAKKQGTVKKIKQKTNYSLLCAHPMWKRIEIDTSDYNQPCNIVPAFILPMPPSANQYWRNINGKTLVSEEAKNYKEAVAALALRLGMQKLSGPVMLTIQVYRQQKSGDLSNRIKVIEDALIGIAYKDDKQIEQILAMRFESPRNPYIIISVTEL